MTGVLLVALAIASVTSAESDVYDLCKFNYVDLLFHYACVYVYKDISNHFTSSLCYNY